MTSRVLPKDQYGRLEDTELGPARTLLPDGADVLVVEDGDRIVGCWALLPFWHCEGIFIAPGYRGRATVARRLWKGMTALARSKGATTMLTGCCSAVVERLLAHAGATALPGTTYAIRIGKD